MQTTPAKILDERRFPVRLTEDMAPIRKLYDRAKAERWDPITDIYWDTIETEAYSTDVLEAAALTWSRCAWIEYARLYETPALLVRLCLEIGREADPKYFLTVRNTEESWLIECFHDYAEAMGGYRERVENPSTELLFNQYRYRTILDGNNDVDALFATYAVAEEGLELALFKAYLKNAKERVGRQILEKAVLSKQRNVDFGWLYLRALAEDWNAEKRKKVGETIHRYFQEVELKGYHCAWLADRASDEAIAAQITADYELGSASAEHEEEILRNYIQDLRAELKALDIPFASLQHQQLDVL